MAKGKLRGSDAGNKISSNGGFKGSDTFTTEFEINETPPSARTLLTKGYVQDEINHFSGATVTTRGRFMTEHEKSRCPNERPLYLYIQGHTKQNVDLAIQKINEIIRTEHQSSLNRPSRFTNAPPPLMSLHSGVPSVEKICVGIENAPQGFNLRERIIGPGGANLLYIRGDTGATVTLRGRGSQFTDPVLGAESPEPLHLYIEHPKPEGLQTAKNLVCNLIQTMQSELQSYIQQQPPPVQSQQVIEQPQMQPMQQAQYQTMNIGALGQPNVVTIQHQDIIQHSQNNVVTLPATVLTATVAGGPGAATQPGVHIPSHAGPLVPTSQSQYMYQLHPGQPQIQIQNIQVPQAQSSTQPVTQMYVMSQPTSQASGQPSFIASSESQVSGAVSYVYTQPSLQRPEVTSQGVIEAPINIAQQGPPPPLLHLHFPPPNFTPNRPPPPLPQTYQIQYQQVPVSQPQAQFVLQHGEHIVEQSHELPPSVTQHIIPAQFEGQGPVPQFHLQIPPPSTQTFLIPNAQQTQLQPPLPPAELQHEVPNEQANQPVPQPVPAPQMVPPPANHISNHGNVMGGPQMQSPPQHPPQNAPWLFQPQHPQQMQQHQAQIQISGPPSGIQLHNMPPPQMQAQIHYAVQPPGPHQSFEQKPGSPGHHKTQGMKRRFSEVDGPQEPLPYHHGPPRAQRHGNGDGDRQQQVLHGSPSANATAPQNDRSKMPMPAPHQGEMNSPDHKPAGPNSGSDGNHPPPPGPHGPQAPWQGHRNRARNMVGERAPWDRPPGALPPTNMPPPQIRPIRGQLDNRVPVQNATPEHQLNAEYNHMMPPGTKPPYHSIPLVHSICNPPPPPPPHHQRLRPQLNVRQQQQYQIPNSQAYQSPISCPPWTN